MGVAGSNSLRLKECGPTTMAGPQVHHSVPSICVGPDTEVLSTGVCTEPPNTDSGAGADNGPVALATMLCLEKSEYTHPELHKGSIYLGFVLV